MVRVFACLFLIAIALPVLAQEWSLRRPDILLDQHSAQALTAGSMLIFQDDGRSKFSVGGAYSYTYAEDGSTEFGIFRVEHDGRVCIDLRNGTERCNIFVRNDGLLVMLTEQGGRFPIRVHMTLRP